MVGVCAPGTHAEQIPLTPSLPGLRTANSQRGAHGAGAARSASSALEGERRQKVAPRPCPHPGSINYPWGSSAPSREPRGSGPAAPTGWSWSGHPPPPSSSPGDARRPLLGCRVAAAARLRERRRVRCSSRPPPPRDEAAGRRAGRCCCCGRWASGGCRSAGLPGSPLPAGETLRTADGGGEGAGRSSRTAPKRRLRAEEAAAAPSQGQHRDAQIGHYRRPRSRQEARSDGQSAGAAPDGVQLITAGGLGDPEPGGGCGSGLRGSGLRGTCRQPAHPPATDTRGTAPSTLGRRRAALARAHRPPPPSLQRDRCACSLSPFPRPAALRHPLGPEILLLFLPALWDREPDSAVSPPAVGRREAQRTSLAPPPDLAADWVLQGNHLHALPAPRPRARARGEREPAAPAALSALSPQWSWSAVLRGGYPDLLWGEQGVLNFVRWILC